MFYLRKQCILERMLYICILSTLLIAGSFVQCLPIEDFVARTINDPVRQPYQLNPLYNLMFSQASSASDKSQSPLQQPKGGVKKEEANIHDALKDVEDDETEKRNRENIKSAQLSHYDPTLDPSRNNDSEEDKLSKEEGNNKHKRQNLNPSVMFNTALFGSGRIANDAPEANAEAELIKEPKSDNQPIEEVINSGAPGNDAIAGSVPSNVASSSITLYTNVAAANLPTNEVVATLPTNKASAASLASKEAAAASSNVSINGDVATNPPIEEIASVNTHINKAAAASSPTDVAAAASSPTDVTAAASSPTDVAAAASSPTDVTAAASSPTDVAAAASSPTDVASAVNTPNNEAAAANAHTDEASAANSPIDEVEAANLPGGAGGSSEGAAGDSVPANVPEGAVVPSEGAAGDSVLANVPEGAGVPSEGAAGDSAPANVQAKDTEGASVPAKESESASGSAKESEGEIVLAKETGGTPQGEDTSKANVAGDVGNEDSEPAPQGYAPTSNLKPPAEEGDISGPSVELAPVEGRSDIPAGLVQAGGAQTGDFPVEDEDKEPKPQLYGGSSHLPESDDKITDGDITDVESDDDRDTKRKKEGAKWKKPVNSEIIGAETLEDAFTCADTRGTLRPLFNGSKYLADYQNYYSYKTARKICTDYRLVLAELDDMADHRSLQNFISTFKQASTGKISKHDRFRIGMNDIKTEGVFRRGNGKPIIFQNFHASQPDDRDQGEDCATLGIEFSDGPVGASDDSCDYKFHVLCMFPVGTDCFNESKENTENMKLLKERGFQLVVNASERAYFVSNYQATWKDAMNNCTSKGMHLFDMDKVVTMGFFESLIKWQHRFVQVLSPPLQYWTSGKFKASHMTAPIIWHKKPELTASEERGVEKHNGTFSWSGLYKWSTRKKKDPGGPYGYRRDLCVSFGFDGNPDATPYIRNTNCLMPGYFICVAEYEDEDYIAH